jgi:hypothetical protein
MSLAATFVDPEVEAAFDRLSIPVNDAGYDPWGFHPETAKVLFSVAKQLSRYFRPEVHGIENIPDGRVLIVPNHSGQLPFDGLVVAVGGGASIIYDLVRLEAVRGFGTGGTWEWIVSVNPQFRAPL